VSNDHEIELEAIEALLRAAPNSGTSSAEAQLDAEFDAVMALLDDIDPEHAAELDALAARARQELDLAAQNEDRPDEPPPPIAPLLRLKHVIPRASRNRRIGAASSKGSRAGGVLRQMGTAAAIVGLVGVTLAGTWGLLLLGNAVKETPTDASPMTELFTMLAVFVHSLLMAHRIWIWIRNGNAPSEQPSWRMHRRRHR
jgi:hypothetical protein